jgi:hypothetical protein
MFQISFALMMEEAFQKHSTVLLQLQVIVLVVVDLHGQYT